MAWGYMRAQGGVQLPAELGAEFYVGAIRGYPYSGTDVYTFGQYSTCTVEASGPWRRFRDVIATLYDRNGTELRTFTVLIPNRQESLTFDVKGVYRIFFEVGPEPRTEDEIASLHYTLKR